jgi:hypothetical protein
MHQHWWLGLATFFFADLLSYSALSQPVAILATIPRVVNSARSIFFFFLTSGYLQLETYRAPKFGHY